MRLCGICVIALGALSSIVADDFWIDRPLDTWSKAEIKRLVTESPWAKQVRMEAPADSPYVNRPIQVRWDSAAPIYEACAKGGMERYLFSCVSKLLYLSGLGNKYDLLRQDYYIIGVSNYPKTLPGPNLPQHSDAANAALEQLSDRIQHTTFLKRKNNPPSKAAKVVTLPAGDTLLVMVFFTRNEALSIDDEEVTFEMADGKIQLHAAFSFKSMLYMGRLAL